jgi:hypothetical protein
MCTLAEGEYMPGLRAVLLHIETAFRHLQRGQETQDETAFTDAIYRSNQAFEGSIKEAYRVLAGKDPDRMRPFDIEGYLEKNNVFRTRILSLFTNYRTEWRNPSTHDYKLDFDESEAFLAIVSVAAFACLLLDQIAEHLAFLAAKQEAEINKPLLEQQLPKKTFAQQHQPVSSSTTAQMESQLVGAISGFLASVTPEYQVRSEEKLVSGRPERADLVIQDKEDRVVVELKRARWSRATYHNALAQLEHYLLLSNTPGGILYFASEAPTEYEVDQHEVPNNHGRIVILRPKREAQPFVAGHAPPTGGAPLN